MCENGFRLFPQRIIWTILLFFSLSLSVTRANHIIGGEMYYECLGYLNNDPSSNIRIYRITMDLYRDCQAQRAADFDNPAGLTIYRQNGQVYDIVAPRLVSMQGAPEDIDPPVYDCLEIPRNVCVHRGRYVFEIPLAIIGESYHIVWQRCCRNQTINNIYTPGDVGATFTIELTPTAQQTCNNSPRFQSFPPIVVCADAPLNIDHSAIDPEGDNIVYELCAPLVGGGMGRTGNPCDAINPDPDCPPPFASVRFRTPRYTSSNPLGGSPAVSINPVTGQITGVPQDLGQFVVGVCAKEYRNGELISVLRRDFQFNVATCTPNFAPDLGYEEIDIDGAYVVNLCDTLSRKMVNKSTGDISVVEWQIDVKDSLFVSNEWAPLIQFAQGGTYRGLFIINPRTPCSDSAELIFHVVEDLNAAFDARYDTCVSGPVQFHNLSSSNDSRIENYHWDFGNRKTDTLTNPLIQYEYPDDFYVSLAIQDEYGCRDTIHRVVVWQPAPEVIIVRPNVREGCTPLTVEFENLSFPLDSNYLIKWVFSDGDERLGLTSTKTFLDTGIYTIKLEVTSPIGCYNEEVFSGIIHAFEPPKADFFADKYVLDELEAVITLTDGSKNNIGREWHLEGGTFFDSTFQYTFKDTGHYTITLIAVDRFGCEDRISKSVDVRPFSSMFFPNAFTPNHDGTNDGFGPVGIMHAINDYEFIVYDRWGQRIFVSNDPNIYWNGKMNNNGLSCPEGVYHYKYSYKTSRGQQVSESGQCTLVR